MACAISLTLVTPLLAGSAQAAPRHPAYPSAERTRQARQAATAAAGRVHRIGARLAAAAARRERAEVALSTAAENYDQARELLAVRRRSAAVAGRQAGAAAARVTGARAELGRLAADAYQSGGRATGLAVVLAPGAGADLLDGAALVRTLAEQRRRMVTRLDTARAVATVLQERSGAALAAQQAAEERVRGARDAARYHAVAARATAASVAREQVRLTAQLAAARHTTIALERRRQQGLAAARARREAIAARPRQRRAQQPGPRADPPESQPEPDQRPVPAAQQQPDPAPDPQPDPKPDPQPDPGRSHGGGEAVAWAGRQIGLPYRWGGAGPDSYDCSGLTMRAWQRSGVRLPHSSRMQYAQVRKIPYRRMRPGDLMFWATDPASPGTIHHVALYAGGGMMVEAPATGLDVRRVPVRWRGAMPFAGRPGA